MGFTRQIGVGAAIILTLTLASPSVARTQQPPPLARTDTDTHSSVKTNDGARWIKRKFYQRVKLCVETACEMGGNFGKNAVIHKNRKKGPMALSIFTSDNDFYGEIIETDDLKADGKRAGTKYTVRHHHRVVRRGLCHNPYGEHHGGSPVCLLKNIEEGSLVIFRPGVCNSSRKRINCRNTKDWQWGKCKRWYRDDKNTRMDTWDTDDVKSKLVCR